MRHVRKLLTVIVALMVLLSLVSAAWAQDGGDGGQTVHTVQAGENLYRIALQYGTTVDAIAKANNVTNPNLIVVGQKLIIPVSGGVVVPPTPTTAPVSATPMPTPVPAPADVVHVVQAGENLFRIALKYNLLTSIVATYNNIENPNLVYVGQEIRIPSGATAAAIAGAAGTPQPTAVPATTQVPGTTPVATSVIDNQASNVGFAYGVQVHLPNQDMASVITKADALDVTWIKQQIEWALYEPTVGNINWTPIDEMVSAADAAGVNILFSVNSAPSWARDSDQEKGPPSEYNNYANFVGQLAQRYKGKVDAYEIWNEQNLRREWNTPNGISAASYVELLRVAYTAIKLSDPAAVVVTGGLAPTGYNDGVNAIDDRVYLRQMYEAGVAEWSDAIGAHPNGWANPPDSTCCRNNRPAVPGWDDHPSFFFKQTLADYREIMKQYGDTGTYIWPTEFGWGSNDGLNVEPGVDFPADYEFVSYTSLDEQAAYIVRAFQLGPTLGYVGPMFLWNLNFCEVVGVTGEQCLWSLLDPVGNPRPAYTAVRDMAK
ncbi:MAG: LysM peptidoglycan-binding domain-containing protein [Anaerolineae bacterium]|nr:LysM peptidoglycan-binding domain-containing protein [Anaerolineae bacterium]